MPRKQTHRQTDTKAVAHSTVRNTHIRREKFNRHMERHKHSQTRRHVDTDTHDDTHRHEDT